MTAGAVAASLTRGFGPAVGDQFVHDPFPIRIVDPDERLRASYGVIDTLDCEDAILIMDHHRAAILHSETLSQRGRNNHSAIRCYRDMIVAHDILLQSDR